MEDRAGSIYRAGSGYEAVARAGDGTASARRDTGVGGRRGVPLVDIWSSLCEGRVALVGHFVTDEACYAALEERSESESLPHRLSATQVEVLVRLVAGEPQKSLAIDLGLSPSAVTLRVQRCIRQLGLHCKPSGLPLFVILAALSPTADQGAIATLEPCDAATGGAGLYGLARADGVLPPVLSCAEQAVARMLVEGRAPTQIAGARRTAERTVANQLASIFAKLGVTGRLELIALLARGGSGGRTRRPGRRRAGRGTEASPRLLPLAR